MSLYVRRISQRWVGKYNLFNFVQHSFDDQPISYFSDKDELREYLKRIIKKETKDTELLRDDVFVGEENIWLFIVDKEMETTYVVKVEFDMNVSLHVINER